MYIKLFSKLLAQYLHLIYQLDLQADYVNQIYCVPQSEIKSYFPQGFPRRLYDQV